MESVGMPQLISPFGESVESKTLEFKRNLLSPKPLLKTLVAFANTAGGRLVIGVDDDRQIIDVSAPLDEEDQRAGACGLLAARCAYSHFVL